MNLLLLPWYIVCATLAQTSAIGVTAFAAVRYLLYSTYVTITGKEYNKEQVVGEMAVGLMTYVPILIIVFSSYTSKQHLVGFKNPLGCIFGPAVSIKIIGKQAMDIYESYLGMKRMGTLDKEEEGSLNGFFKWLNKHKELWEDLVLAPYRFLSQRS